MLKGGKAERFCHLGKRAATKGFDRLSPNGFSAARVSPFGLSLSKASPPLLATP
jgi:hypothetical protein